MSSRIYLGAVALAIAAVAALAVPQAGLAATFRVSPTVIDHKGAPGKAITGTFKVELKGQGSHRFTVQVLDAVQNPDGTFGYTKPTKSPFSAATWTSATPKSFAGSPNRTQIVQYQVQIPKNAEPGDHTVGIRVTQVPKSNSQVVATAAEAIAARLDIRVAGKAKPSAKIASLDSPTIAGSSPVNVSATVKNTGNVRLDFDHQYSGAVYVNSGSDKKATQNFNGTLYPGQTRLYELSWDNPPLFGHYSASASVDLGKHPVSDSKTLWVIPWRQIGALILIAIAVALLVVGIQRRRRAAAP